MIGDGTESGFLSLMLFRDLHFSAEKVSLVFTAYGATAALASWLSGALTDIFGPKKIMWAGLLIWLGFEMPFLLLGLAHANYTTILISYGIRGLGYPFFAYGFLCWIAAVTPERYLGTAVGWFWSARTGGLPTLGALLASFALPLIGGYKTLWVSVALVAIGGLIVLFGVSEGHGNTPLSTTGENPLRVLFTGVSVIWRHPKVGLGGIVATITTTSEFGFLVFLPIFYTSKQVGFTEAQWLQIVFIIFATNVVANLFWGWVGDKVGWRRTITFAGACGCALTSLGFFYVPHIFGANYLLVALAGMAYGIALAGFVPIAAIMAVLAPESRGASMSIMNLGSGLSTFTGPAIFGIFFPMVGVSGVVWIFAAMYVISAVLSYMLKIPGVRALR
jgi:polyol permease family